MASGSRALMVDRMSEIAAHPVIVDCDPGHCAGDGWRLTHSPQPYRIRSRPEGLRMVRLRSVPVPVRENMEYQS